MAFGKRGSTPPGGHGGGPRNGTGAPPAHSAPPARPEERASEFYSAVPPSAARGGEFYTDVPPPSQPIRDAVNTGGESPSGWQAFAGGLLYASVILGIIGSILYIVLLVVPKPIYLSSPRKVYISWRSYALDTMRGDKEYRRKHGYSLEDLVIRPGDAQSKALLDATMSCGQDKYPSYLLVAQSPMAYGPVTDYMACVMKIHPERFCDPREREILLRQLKKYSYVRQAVLGVERARDMMLNSSPFARPALMRARRIMSKMSGKAEPDVMATIGKKVHPKVILALADLIRNGYIRKEDFSFMGLVLPEDYAPAFKLVKHVSAPVCQ